MSGEQERVAAAENDRHRLAIASDHEGFRQKERLVLTLREDRHTVKDLGVHGKGDTSDFIEAAELVARALLNLDSDIGIIVCGAGAGASMAANKIAGMRASYCTDTVTARQCRRQVDANVLCIGTRVVGDELAIEIARAWLQTPFSCEQRHERLVHKLVDLEQQFDAASARREEAAEGGD